MARTTAGGTPAVFGSFHTASPRIGSTPVDASEVAPIVATVATVPSEPLVAVAMSVDFVTTICWKLFIS